MHPSSSNPPEMPPQDLPTSSTSPEVPPQAMAAGPHATNAPRRPSQPPLRVPPSPRRHLEGVGVEGAEDEGGGDEADALGDEGRVDGPGFEEVGVVADLPQLHQHVDDAHEVPTGQGGLGAAGGGTQGDGGVRGGHLGTPPPRGRSHPPGLAHEVVVEVALALGEAALEDVLVFLGHLLLDVHLQAAEEEGAEHLGEGPVSSPRGAGLHPTTWGSPPAPGWGRGGARNRRGTGRWGGGGGGGGGWGNVSVELGRDGERRGGCGPKMGGTPGQEHPKMGSPPNLYTSYWVLPPTYTPNWVPLPT